MNKSLSYVNLSLELHVVSTFWLGSQVLFLYIYFVQPSYELERPALENAHTLVQRTDIFSCKFSVKISVMLDNPFLVPSLCKLNHITISAFASFRLAQNHLQNCLFPSGKALFFWSHSRCFGPFSKFQHNIKFLLRWPVFPDYLFLVTMVSIIITIFSNITMLVSYNVIWLGYFMPMSHSVNNNPSQVPPTTFLSQPGFRQVCFLFYKKYFINLVLLWSNYLWKIMRF